jgi:hypothetical protein
MSNYTEIYKSQKNGNKKVEPLTRNNGVPWCEHSAVVTNFQRLIIKNKLFLEIKI